MINMYNLSKKRSIWKKYNFYILLCILTVIIAIITYYRVLIQSYTAQHQMLVISFKCTCVCWPGYELL